MKEIQGKNKVFFGTKDGERIYITKPTFDCGWYWSFGYLGNAQCHYHLSSYQNKEVRFKDAEGKFRCFTELRNLHMCDCLLKDYALNPVILDNLWVFCELALTIYTLKETADIYHAGGSHTTTNPCKDMLKNDERYQELVGMIIPELCQKLWDIIDK